MSDHSLMNPEFLRKELEDCVTLYAEDQMFVRELDISINNIFDMLVLEELASSNHEIVKLTRAQTSEIIRVLSDVQLHKYKFTSARKVAINQYKRLLQDRRYRIATRLLNIFK